MNRCCPVCERSNASLLYRPKKSPGPVSQCQQCGMVYVSEVKSAEALIFDGPVRYGDYSDDILTSSNLNDVADSWELHMLPHKLAEENAFRRNALSALKSLESHHLPTRRRLLDFGSGWGFFNTTAKELGWQTVGLEPLPASSVYARSAFGLEIVTDTLREGLFSAESFDVITSFQVFEHLPQPKHDLNILHNLLAPYGLILIEVPNFKTWGVSLLKERHRHFVSDHLNFFDANTLSRLLRDCGFAIITAFQSARTMSVRHLFEFWLAKFLPSAASGSLKRGLVVSGLYEQMFALNLGDILTVIARKI